MVDQITPDELADKLDADEPITLIDTRETESFDAWHISGAVNIPYHPRNPLTDTQIQQIKNTVHDDSILTICAKGLTSTPFAFQLEQLGYTDVTIIKGGMEDWSKVYEVVPIETENDDLRIIQIQRRGKGCLGYVIGDTSTGEAAVVDPTRQIAVFEIAAEEAGLTIKHVIDTHIHADHISGGPELADVLNVPYYLSVNASDRGVTHQFTSVGEGDTLTIGDVELEPIHAPGHTTEMLNYLINDTYLLTSDTLFIESVGRTELQFGNEGAEAGAKLLYETIHEKLLTVSDDIQILPGHITVTPEGQYERGEPGDPIIVKIGELRESLELLRLNEEEFVDRLVENAPDKPSNYETIIAINTGNITPENNAEATELELGPNNCAA